ncbi:ribosome small subunit-dependent GTPase A [Mycoplasmoides pirum]|uniref:ribosome small subunit-dependent GTPase A n=1 Tax=Mycoplasmoides pirum TaxID=2122 RepID=UPI000486420E|nr:ribosome small subunit-dependent GTPase A [Mycoplasmoides pirum]
MKAIILKINANQIVVWYKNEKYEVFAPGKWKKNLILRPGDKVELILKNNEYQINTFFKRKNCLDKPKVANIDNIVIVQSYVMPNINWNQLLKTLFFYEYHLNIKPIVVITKTDIVNLNSSDQHYLDDLKKQDYLIFVKNNENDFNNFLLKLSNKITSFVGQSGVGKSTLINDINPNFLRLTNEISKKLKRGKNTTTQTELLPFNGGFLVDTPGYSKFSNNLDERQLSIASNLFKILKLKCKFQDCLHINELNCAIKNAVNNSLIPKWQYDIYVHLQKQLKKNNFLN